MENREGKRKADDDIPHSRKRQHLSLDCSRENVRNRYSANDRLQKYRRRLEERKNENIKVHQVFEQPLPSLNPIYNKQDPRLKSNTVLPLQDRLYKIKYGEKLRKDCNEVYTPKGSKDIYLPNECKARKESIDSCGSCGSENERNGYSGDDRLQKYCRRSEARKNESCKVDQVFEQPLPSLNPIYNKRVPPLKSNTVSPIQNGLYKECNEVYTPKSSKDIYLPNECKARKESIDFFGSCNSENVRNRYSADDRLQKYRRSEERKNGSCKVHQVFEQPLPSLNPIYNKRVPPLISNTVSPIRNRLYKDCIEMYTPKSSKDLYLPNECKARKDCCGSSSTEVRRKVSTSMVSNVTFEVPVAENSELMDWSPIDENIIISNLQEIRQTIIKAKTLDPQTPFQKEVANSATTIPQNYTILKDIYIVIDSNIFISHMDVIENVLDIKINGVVAPIILIPWIVIQELDYMKDRHSYPKQLRTKAQKAVKFINNSLLTMRDRVKGQTVLDATKQISSANSDDGILFCCLQIVEKKNTVILLTNDINLRNKALVHDVPAFSHSEIIQYLDPFNSKNTNKSNINEMRMAVSKLFSFIIVTQIKTAYGECWNKMALMDDPPWTLEECLQRLEKYWKSVFSYHIQKQCEKLISEFRIYLKSNFSEIEKKRMIEYSLSLCAYFKNGLPAYSENIKSCIKEIEQISGSLQ